MQSKEQYRVWLKALELDREIFKLADQGFTDELIANTVKLPVDKVTTRIKRRHISPETVTPREIIVRRAVGDIETSKMMEMLKCIPYVLKSPKEIAAYDGAVSGTGTAKDVMFAYQQGLLSEEEYETLRKVNVS